MLVLVYLHFIGLVGNVLTSVNNIQYGGAPGEKSILRLTRLIKAQRGANGGTPVHVHRKNRVQSVSRAIPFDTCGMVALWYSFNQGSQVWFGNGGDGW